MVVLTYKLRFLWESVGAIVFTGRNYVDRTQSLNDVVSVVVGLHNENF